MKNIFFALLLFICIINYSCYVSKYSHNKFRGISSANIELLIYPLDTVTNKSIKLNCKLFNNSQNDIAIARIDEIKATPEEGQFFWFADITCLKDNKKKYIPLYDFFTLSIDKENYIILEAGESRDVSFIIYINSLSNREYPLEELEYYLEEEPNTDYGEYSINIIYFDQYRAHPYAINGKVVSNPIKVIYQKY